LLQILLQNRYVPVIAPVAIGENSEPLNVDGDRTAAYVASSVKADRLILLTDVEGLILNSKLVSKLNVVEARSSLPKIGRGMITKVNAATEALSMGVGEVLISSGFAKFPISSPLKHEIGTVITRE
jgi:acetylglutamate/LysW-gamma-L-alpha-aminoadipate kinase